MPMENNTDTQAIQQAVMNLPALRDLVAAADLKARKSLGQNFLFDLNLTAKIARAATPFANTVIEIGPGPGGLTRALLLEGAQQVIAVEKDRRVLGFLQHLIDAANGRLTFMEADALVQAVWELGTAPRQIIANLPYNIATTLLLQWLEHADDFASFILMFQKEVAMRITAQPGDAAYGRLSIITQWRATAECVFDIPPEAFIPPPKITSTVVRIIPRAKPLADCTASDLEAVTAIAFGQRRKMLRASFKRHGGAAFIEEAGIDPASRPQDLPIEAFCALARLYRERREQP
jgi:16S rRNA (adenine1518-N6/adenine1519-N6)-dimethyltransferase